MSRNIIEKIESKIDYLAFYNEYVQGIKPLGDDQYIGQCPLHDDENPSFAFNVKDGLWNCFSNCGGGNVFSFLEKKENLSSKQERVQFLCKKLGIELTEDDYTLEGKIEEDIWKNWHKSLVGNKAVLDVLLQKRGITLETVKQFKLGFYRNRLTIPVFDSEGVCRNVRQYSFIGKKVANKLINYSDGSEYSFGRMRLFPIENVLTHKKILLCEGEPDTLLANQMGFKAMTVTSGAGSWNKAWSHKYFKGKQVWICFDIDAAGMKGAIRVAKALAGLADFVKIVDLKKVMTSPPSGDFTDFFLTNNNDMETFKELLVNAKEYYEAPEIGKEVRNKEFRKVSLSQASHAKNALCNIEVKALVSGKDFPPFEIPNKLHIECDAAGGEKMCPFCPMYTVPGNKKDIYLKEETDRGSLLNLIDIKDELLFRNMRKQLGIPFKCERTQMKIKDYINIEELRLIPEIDFTTDTDYEYVQQVAYYAGHGIKANQVYTLQGMALPNPKTQQSTQIFWDAVPAVDSIDLFKMNDEIHERLKFFQPAPGQTLTEKYDERYADMEYVSGIYQRKDIALTYDIVLHSALEVMFQNKKEKAWMEALLIGDSGCGKTELAKAMIRHYGVAEFVTGESTSVAGLIGGLSQTAKRWHINWGKIPLNNRRALFIDEISGMSIEDIALFSGVRSSGIAELTKIRTEKTQALTRKIWVGNPRRKGNLSRNMMQYPYGIVAIQELIGNLEDIRRFDFALTAHSEEVDKKIYNALKEQGRIIEYTGALCHELIMWSWSRKPNQIIFSAKANKAILKYAQEMGEKYYHGIPIVEAADQRLKIMRGSISVAVMFYSTKDGTQIKVEEEHVEFFHDWLEEIYNKDSMRYGDWSYQELSKKKLKDQSAVDRLIRDEFIEMLLEDDTFNQASMIDLTGWERGPVKAMISTLRRNNAIKRYGTSFYIKTDAFIDYLNRRKTGEIQVNQAGSGPEEEEPAPW
jgi:hypothetical protein